MSTWYEKWPKRLEAEKFKMEKFFPKLHLEKLNDDRLSWVGEIYSYAGLSYHVRIIYPPEYPHQSPRVYPISQEGSEGFKGAPHLMPDGSLCLSYPRFDSATITAFQIALGARSWIQGFVYFINTGNFPDLNTTSKINETHEGVLIQNFGTMVNSPIQQGNEHAEQNILETSASDSIQELLRQLATEVEKLSKLLPDETIREIKQDLTVLQAESISKNPRKRWYELSADGLIKAATNLGAIGKPVVELVTQILMALKNIAV